MGNRRGLGFGGFLVGLGVGWIIFTSVDVSSRILAWLLIAAGGAIVATALLSYISPGFRLTGVAASVVAGLVIALVFTSGFGIFWPGPTNGGPYPYSKEEPRSYSGVATAEKLLFQVESINGQIDVSTWEKDEFSIELTVKARGATESEAQSNLEKVDTSIDERLVQGRLELTLTIDVPRLTWNRVSVDVTVTLPADAVVDLDVETTNGAISLARLNGGTLKFRTTNGVLSFDKTEAITIRGSTTNGRIEGDVEAESLIVDTTNGVIELIIPSLRSGEYDLETTNGNVDIKVVPSDAVGFNLDVSTSVSTVTFDLPNLNYDLNTARHKRAQTEGYEDKPIRISIDASTTNGSGKVHD